MLLDEEVLSKAVASALLARDMGCRPFHFRLFTATTFLSRCLATEERREENGLRPVDEPASPCSN